MGGATAQDKLSRGGERRSSASLDRILRKPELVEITGVSVATLYRWIAEGAFPRPVKLGPNSVGWRASEVQVWIESRVPVGPGVEANRGQ